MNTIELDIAKLKGKILVVESNIPLLLHKSDHTTEIFRVVPSVDSDRLFCGGKKKALVAFPTKNLSERLVEIKCGEHKNILQKALVPGMLIKVIHTSEKSIVIDHVERNDK